MLPTPISLQSSEEFTITATINGPPSKRGVRGKLSVKADDIVVNFKNPPEKRTNGTGATCGQFYKLFFHRQ